MLSSGYWTDLTSWTRCLQIVVAVLSLHSLAGLQAAYGMNVDKPIGLRLCGKATAPYIWHALGSQPVRQVAILLPSSSDGPALVGPYGQSSLCRRCMLSHFSLYAGALFPLSDNISNYQAPQA